MPNVWILSLTTAAEGNIALAEQQLLGTLNQSRVAGRTGGTDRVVRSGDAHVQGDLAGRVVGHGARIVMVRPNTGVVVVLFDLVDFIFGLDVAMLGNTDIHPHALAVEVLPVEPRVGNRLVRAVNADAAGAGATTNFAAFLVLQFVEVTNASQGLADISNVVRLHTAAAME